MYVCECYCARIQRKLKQRNPIWRRFSLVVSTKCTNACMYMHWHVVFDRKRTAHRNRPSSVCLFIYLLVYLSTTICTRYHVYTTTTTTTRECVQTTDVFECECATPAIHASGGWNSINSFAMMLEWNEWMAQTFGNVCRGSSMWTQPVLAKCMYTYVDVDRTGESANGERMFALRFRINSFWHTVWMQWLLSSPPPPPQCHICYRIHFHWFYLFACLIYTRAPIRAFCRISFHGQYACMWANTSVRVRCSYRTDRFSFFLCSVYIFVRKKKKKKKKTQKQKLKIVREINLQLIQMYVNKNSINCKRKREYFVNNFEK